MDRSQDTALEFLNGALKGGMEDYAVPPAGDPVTIKSSGSQTSERRAYRSELRSKIWQNLEWWCWKASREAPEPKTARADELKVKAIAQPFLSRLVNPDGVTWTERTLGRRPERLPSGIFPCGQSAEGPAPLTGFTILDL